MIKQTTGIFEVNHSFRHEHNQTEDKVSIRLSIDYESGQYSITPNVRTTDFRFPNGRNNSTKWKAICTCIVQAIETAEKELKQIK